jgi:DNA-binding sugar fermentation-stimulating protein
MCNYTMQSSTPTPLYTLPRALQRATVLARPSRTNKSPYLADIHTEDGTICMAHTPALGCCGLIAPGALVWVMPSAGGGKTVSKYTIYLVELADGTRICAHPTVANEVAEGLLRSGLVGSEGPNAQSAILPGLTELTREVTVGVAPVGPNALSAVSRFDFAGRLGDGRRAIIEVKSVPIADYVDCMPRDRAKALAATPIREGPKMAIFPYGTIRKEGVISERAIKHAQGLATLARTDEKPVCVMLYLSMRTDIDRFTASSLDKTYKAAVADAIRAGVRVLAYSIRWDANAAYLSHPLALV